MSYCRAPVRTTSTGTCQQRSFCSSEGAFGYFCGKENSISDEATVQPPALNIRQSIHVCWCRDTNWHSSHKTTNIFTIPGHTHCLNVKDGKQRILSTRQEPIKFVPHDKFLGFIWCDKRSLYLSDLWHFFPQITKHLEFCSSESPSSLHSAFFSSLHLESFSSPSDTSKGISWDVLYDLWQRSW